MYDYTIQTLCNSYAASANGTKRNTKAHNEIKGIAPSNYLRLIYGLCTAQPARGYAACQLNIAHYCAQKRKHVNFSTWPMYIHRSSAGLICNR